VKPLYEDQKFHTLTFVNRDGACIVAAQRVERSVVESFVPNGKVFGTLPAYQDFWPRGGNVKKDVIGFAFSCGLLQSLSPRGFFNMSAIATNVLSRRCPV
jgi:hypothetical protein